MCFSWTQTAAITAVNGLENSHHEDSKLSWHRGKYVVSRSEDQCRIGAWVYPKTPFVVWAIWLHFFIRNDALILLSKARQPPIAGRILKILQDTTAKRLLVVLDTFQVAATRHETFGMPVLLRRLNEKSLVIVPAMVSRTNLLCPQACCLTITWLSEHFV